MRILFATLFAASAVFSAGFALRLGRPWRNREPVMAWLQAALAWVAVAWDVVWTALTLSIVVPIWVFAVVLAAQDAVFGWRWWVLETSRRHDRGEITTP